MIRYDHRDTGRSTTCRPGKRTHTGTDLATDPLRIFDSLDLGRAHVVGLSLGGGIAQLMAARWPARVNTHTLTATSTAWTAPTSARCRP